MRCLKESISNYAVIDIGNWEKRLDDLQELSHAFLTKLLSALFNSGSDLFLTFSFIYLISERKDPLTHKHIIIFCKRIKRQNNL